MVENPYFRITMVVSIFLIIGNVSILSKDSGFVSSSLDSVSLSSDSSDEAFEICSLSFGAAFTIEDT